MGRYVEEGLFCIERESSLEVKYTSHEDRLPREQTWLYHLLAVQHLIAMCLGLPSHKKVNSSTCLLG